jgi:small subunit ribosomal protein S5
MIERPSSRQRRPREKKEPSEFDQTIVDIARVTRVMAGGKRMRFRACVVIGDRKGRVGVGVMKGADVTAAINKAVTQAKKRLLKVKMANGTIPHRVVGKYGGAQVLLKPAPEGTGVIAGGPVRSVLDLAGIHNVTSKMLGSNNKINNVRAAMCGLESLMTKEDMEMLRKS